MLTSPQSIINCSFQMCQRGKGLRGRLERAEGRETRGDQLCSCAGRASRLGQHRGHRRARRGGGGQTAAARASEPEGAGSAASGAGSPSEISPVSGRCAVVTPSLKWQARGQEPFYKGPVFLGFAGHMVPGATIQVRCCS